MTHRGLATSFTVVTGHSRHAVDRETNWDALAAAGGTIVVLMGVAHRAAIASHLMAGGLAPTTPVMAVRWGTRPEQATVRTTLGALGDTPLEPPVTIVVGPVAALDLAWFERRPLFGRRVIVTRARADASALSQRLRALGAEVVELPTIEVIGPADGGAALAPGRGRPGRGPLPVGGVHLAPGRRALPAPVARRPFLRPGVHRGHRPGHRGRPRRATRWWRTWSRRSSWPSPWWPPFPTPRRRPGRAEAGPGRVESRAEC